jgi:hypothetical protein
MQYQVLVEHKGANRFTASVIGLADCVVEGRTEAEAIAKVQEALRARLSQGKVIKVDAGSAAPVEHPLLKHAGRFRNDPTFDDFVEEIEKYRRELDAEDQPQ